MKWVGICVDPDLNDSDVRTHARDFGLKFPVVRDRHGALARKLGATMVPEAFVIDAQNQVRYHGRIDDQFARRGVRNANPSGNELKDAIAAVLKGAEVKVPFVAVVGCPLPEQKALATDADLQQGRGANPPAKLPGMPSPGAGGPVCPRVLLAGPKAGRGYRRRSRGSIDAAVEGGTQHRRPIQARPVALREGHRDHLRLG